MLKSTMTMPGVLCALLGLLLIPSSGLARSHIADCLVVESGQTHTLQDNESWSCVSIEIEGTLYTNGHELTITDANGLKIAGSLIVDGGCVTLEGGGDCGIGINGALCLLTSDATLNIEADTTFTGSGSIVGKNNAARIDIAANTTLMSHVTVVGNMLIKGLTGGMVNGEFDNRHVVSAETNGGTLEFHADTRVRDSGTKDADAFQAIDGATLKFSRNANLHSMFYIHNGNGASTSTLDVGDNDISTCGTFEYDSGDIDTNTGGGSFAYALYATGSACTNPADSGSGSMDCSSRFLVDSDKNCP